MKRRLIIGIFLLSLAIRSMHLLTTIDNPIDHWDASHISIIAQNIAEGHGFATEPGHPTAYRSPLYPYMVSMSFRLTGVRYRPVLFFQAMLGALVSSGAALLAWRLGGRGPAVLTGLLCALDTDMIGLSGFLLTETLFSVLILVSCFMLSAAVNGRSRLLFMLAGLSVGVSMLCRPVASVFAALSVAYLVLSARGRSAGKLVDSGLFVAGVALALSPWLLYTNSVLGAPTLNTGGGRTFWEFRHNDYQFDPELSAMPSWMRETMETADPRGFFAEGGDLMRLAPMFALEPWVYAYYYSDDVASRFDGLTEVEADREYYRLGLEYVRHHPMRTLAGSFRDLLCAFSPGGRNERMNPALLLVTPFIGLGLLALVRHGRSTGRVLALALASFLLLSFVVHYEPRFRAPYVFIHMIAGSLGVFRLAGSRLSRGEISILFAWWILCVAGMYLQLSSPATS